MTSLRTAPNLRDPDDVYQRLIEMHAGRDEADSHRVNARLILLLANHIGDREIVLEAIRLAAR